MTDEDRLRIVLIALLDREVTFVGNEVRIPFASHAEAIGVVADGRRLLRASATPEPAARRIVREGRDFDVKFTDPPPVDSDGGHPD